MAERASHDNLTIQAKAWRRKHKRTGRHYIRIVLFTEPGTRYFLTATEARTLADQLHDAADQQEAS